jgi:DNA-binding transcriptional LysR family regulator
MKSFDPDLLATLVAFADSGSLAKAAMVVGRTASAVTAQMQRLEECAGIPILVPAGRGRSLTEAGERLVGHARRILAANDDAWRSVANASVDERVAIGMTQDFANAALAADIKLFARSHPRVRLDVRVGRSEDLTEAFTSDRLDIMIALRRAVERDEAAVATEAMLWLCASGGPAGAAEEVPLALLDPPCSFRDAAVQALDRAGRPYRIVGTSTSLAGLLVALRAGIAVTVRTARWIEPGIEKAPSRLDLPVLPKAEFSLRVRNGVEPAARRLATVLAEGLRRVK